MTLVSFITNDLFPITVRALKITNYSFNINESRFKISSRMIPLSLICTRGGGLESGARELCPSGECPRSREAVKVTAALTHVLLLRGVHTRWGQADLGEPFLKASWALYWSPSPPRFAADDNSAAGRMRAGTCQRPAASPRQQGVLEAKVLWALPLGQRGGGGGGSGLL